MATPNLPLVDIILPEPISLWPLAIGWWFLLFLAVLTIIVLIISIYKHQKKWGYRKESLALLKHYYQQWQQTQNSSQACQAMLTVLKRTAITAYPQQAIDALYGADWVKILNQQIKGSIDHTLSQAICEQQYSPLSEIDIEQVYLHCRQWVKQHHRQFQEGN